MLCGVEVCLDDALPWRPGCSFSFSRVAVGLPGAGKSRVINYRYALDPRRRKPLATTVVLDLDKEIAEHPDFDPANPDKVYLSSDQEVYKWADARVEARFLSGLADPSIKRLVVDGTGTNVARQERTKPSVLRSFLICIWEAKPSLSHNGRR